MSDLRELYQEVILDHGRNPRNLKLLANANRQAHGRNTVCGDVLTVFLRVNDEGMIDESTFVGHGCAISVASASIMTEILPEKSESEARKLANFVHRLCVGEHEVRNNKEDDKTDLSEKRLYSQLSQLKALAFISQEEFEKIFVLSGVSQFPIRVKCATLAWHTMLSAISGSTDIVSTE